MQPRDFCYWLQGYFELTGENDVNGDYITLDRHQVQIIKDHLKLVFDKQTPTYNPGELIQPLPNWWKPEFGPICDSRKPEEALNTTFCTDSAFVTYKDPPVSC